MHFPRTFLAVIAPAVLITALHTQPALSQSACPAGQHESTDTRGVKWCMDSEGRSFQAELGKTPTASLPKQSTSKLTKASQGNGLPPEAPLAYSSDDRPLSGEDLRLYKFMEERRAIDAAKKRQQEQESAPAERLDAEPTVTSDPTYLKCEQASARSVSAEDSVAYARQAYMAKNAKEALCWAKRSADMGYPDGIGVLGTLYYVGDIVPENPELAVRYLTLATEKGDSFGTYYLGLCYKDGFGVEKSYARFMDLRAQTLAKPDGVHVVSLMESEGFNKAVAEDERRRHEENNEGEGACRTIDGKRIPCARPF
jgi:hypothetical protein